MIKTKLKSDWFVPEELRYNGNDLKEILNYEIPIDMPEIKYARTDILKALNYYFGDGKAAKVILKKYDKARTEKLSKEITERVKRESFHYTLGDFLYGK